MKTILFICLVGLSLASDEEVVVDDIEGKPRWGYQPPSLGVDLDPNNPAAEGNVVIAIKRKDQGIEIVKILSVRKLDDVYYNDQRKGGSYYEVDYNRKMVGDDQLYRCLMIIGFGLGLLFPRNEKTAEVDSNYCEKMVQREMSYN